MNIEQAFKEVTGLSIEEGIQKAVEGGWDSKGTTKKVLVPVMHGMIVATQEQEVVDIRLAVLDPSFWQALGKILGWEGYCDIDGTDVEKPDATSLGMYEKPVWYWHRLIDLLATQREVS